MPTSATAVPPGFTDTLVASVGSPTALSFTPDQRLLVATQFGDLRVVQGGTLLSAPALDLGPVLCTADEEGLLGVAVDPSFASNGFVYLYYTRDKSGTCGNRVSRFTMSGNTISLASELVLVDEIPATGNHNAGDLRFGNDGYLYVSVGDGGCDYAGNSGCAGDNDASRDQHALVGKILRITSTGGIPPSNPFQGAGTARCNVTGRTTAGNKCQETFAWGLRNPFRIAFDPNTTATRFFINDVGQGVWEEIDLGVAGADYGWNVREGPCANGSLSDCGAPPAGMTNPVYAYSHPESGCAAITGGAFVPNGVWPSSFDGTYIYGDYTCGKIFVLSPNGSGGYTRSEFTNDVGAVVNMTFGPSPRGQGLYYTNYSNGGEVRLIESTTSTNRAPTARVTASPTSGPAPLAVNFDGSASTDPDAGDTLSYIWNFGDGSPITTTSSATTSHSYTTAGSFTATLTVRDNHGAVSPAAQVRIDPGNAAPQVTIDTPTTSARFAVGQTITLHGTATDAEDGTLPSSSLSWLVLRHHDTHTHPFLAPTTGNDVPITQPPPEDLGSGIDGYLEIQLTATDSRGVKTTVTRNVLPKKVDLTFSTSPAALNLVIGGTSYTAPKALTSWEGYAFTVNAPSQTDGSGRVWNFQSWSDAGAATHSIVTPATPTTYTATFVQGSASGLVAAYGFDAGSGSSAADSSGKGNVGSIFGAVWAPAGRYGSALSFDGVDDWVTVADANSLDLATAMTLEAWVRPSALGGWRNVVVKERPGGIVYGVSADQAGGLPVGQVFIGSERNATGSAGLPLNAWSHLASTYDGSFLRLYVNGTLVSSTAVTGAMAASTGVLRLGGNSVWGEWFTGLIDEVRVYDRALSAAEVQRDMATAVTASPPPADTSAPSTPSGLGASTSIGSVGLSWAASSDNVGVTRYNVHRSQTSGFTPAAGNRIAQPTGTSYTDSGLAGGTYYYRVTAEDAAGNISSASAQLTVVVPADQAPSVSVTAPASGATVSGTVSLTASASDDVGVAGVQFRLGSVSLGSEDTSAPYSISWDTSTVSNGSYSITAVARDTANQTTTSSAISVIVSNAAPTTGLVAAYGFNAGAGSTAADSSAGGNTGTISGAAWDPAGRYGSALSFDGINDWVTTPDANSLDLTNAMTLEAWVRPSALGGWRTVVFKERPGGIVYTLYGDEGGGRPGGQVFIGAERNATGTAALPLNAWTHLATTFDGAVVRLYVNGVLAGSTAISGAMAASTGVLRIGGNSIWGEWFAGLIDEVRIYNRVLSSAEVQQDMQVPIG